MKTMTKAQRTAALLALYPQTTFRVGDYVSTHLFKVGGERPFGRVEMIECNGTEVCVAWEECGKVRESWLSAGDLVAYHS